MKLKKLRIKNLFQKRVKAIFKLHVDSLQILLHRINIQIDTLLAYRGQTQPCQTLTHTQRSFHRKTSGQTVIHSAQLSFRPEINTSPRSDEAKLRIRKNTKRKIKACYPFSTPLDELLQIGLSFRESNLIKEQK